MKHLCATLFNLTDSVDYGAKNLSEFMRLLIQSFSPWVNFSDSPRTYRVPIFCYEGNKDVTKIFLGKLCVLPRHWSGDRK